MPTGETAELAGGRVTRSLRKRLTSIDSDASSRPGTPNLATLQTIPETNTPTKRLTRRASLSTPAPATPSKETTNTPGRRVNRRRSINYSDSEDNAIPVQPIAKEPTIAVVKEEPESPKGRAKRVLRSSSKSPNESENNTTKSKRGRKKIIKEEEPETIVPDNTTEEESVKAQSVQKKTRVTIKKETVVEEEIKKIKQKTPNKSDLTLEQAEDDNKSPMKSPTKRGSLLTQTTPDSKKCLPAQKERRISESIIASQQSPSQKIRCFSLSQLSQPLAQSTQKSPPKKNNPEPLKSVLFTASDDENDEKTVYPKTPGLAKSKSYILDGSNNVDKDDTFKSSKKDHSEAGSFDDDNDKEVEEGAAVHDTKTPHKLKSLGGVESSTPIQQKNSPQKNPKSVEILAKDIAAKEYVFSDDDDDDDDDKQKISSFQKSFSQSYSKKAGNTPKVDPVVQETSIAEKKMEGVANKSQSNTPSSNIKNKSNQVKTLDSDLSGDEIDHLVQNVSGTAENKSTVQNAKLLYSPKPPLAVQESTSIQPKMKSEETGLKNPAKEYVFSDDDDDEDEKQEDTSPQKSSNTSVSETKKADKATTNTLKNSSPKKSPLSKAQCSDSSEEDDDDVVEKGDKKEDKSISKSLISTSTKSPNKSFMKTPTKSPNKKSRLSKAQCSDSSEDDGEVIEKDNKKEQIETATPTPKSPNKAKSFATDKSTPTMQNKSPEKKRKSIEIQQTDVISSADEGNDDEKQKVVEFPTSWNTGVSGTNTEISKLDCITPEKSMSKAEDAEDQSKAQNNISVEKPVGRQTINSDTSDDDIDRREAGYEFDEDEEEDENREKSMYIDDEAMEVPPGEESSYSEDENALPEYGESIGSQDSPDEDIDDVDGDDEPDEDDEAFIVSDTEPVEELISSEEEEPENLKKYKRIYQASESSDDEVELKSEPNAKDKSLKEQSKIEKTETIQSPKKSPKEDVVAKLQTPKKYNRIHHAPESSGDEEVQISANATSPNKDETDICLLVDSTFEDDKDDDVKVSMDTKTLDKSLKEDSKIEKKELPRRSTRKSNNSKSDSDNNKLNKTVQDMDFNSDSGLKEEEVDRSKPIVLEQIIILPIGIEQEQKLTKSPSKRRSAAIISINNDESEVDNMEDEDQKSLNEPRKSLPATNKKSPSKKSRKSIIAVSLDSSDEEDIASDVKALSQSQAEEESEATGKSRKSSISQSRKSLIRTSTEETNKSEDENNLEKTTFELEGDESEPEETQAASKAKKRSMNKSGAKEDLNTSGRRSRNVSLHEEFETATKSRKSSFNESRKSLVRTSTEETNENEETLSAHETSKKLLDNQDSNEVETKSQRRKSIVAQQSVSLQDSENTADSEKGKQQKPPQRRKSISQPAPPSSDAEEDDEEGEEKENNSSPEATDTEMENSRNDPAEAQFSDGEDDDEKTAANQTVSSFLSEKAVKQNASRRKSIAATESSKLDETFQLDPKNSLSSTLHESLHRNVLKQNLNQKRRQTIEVTTKSNDSSDSEDEDNSSVVEGELEIKKKVISEKGLSVSLNSIKIKKKKLKERKEIRNSFTIGVSLRMNSSEDESSPSKPEPEEADRALENGAASSENERVSSDEGDEGGNEDSSESEGKLLNDSEEEVLEKVKNVQSVVPPKSRKSLSILAPQPSDTGDVKPKKAIKRTSLYLQEHAASSSFVENLAEEKKKIKQQKRKSNSFCGVVKPPSEDDDDFVQRPLEPRSEKKLKKSSESSEGNKKEVNVSKVLSRCEQMLEAANEAKRLAKMQAKKVKVKKPKWMDKDEKATAKEEDQVTIPLVSKKEIKRKEKLKKELEKALKHSAAVLTKAADPALKNKQKNVSAKPTTKIASPSKRLDDDFLESLIQLSNPSKKKTKAIETTPPSDKENSKKKSQKQKYKIEDVHTQIQSDIETLETACGTVIVEPSTPKKLRIQHGFRESPKTPRGYKIQDITSLSNKKSNHKADQRKFKTSSGAFFEEDVKTSKTNKDKKRKRKLPFIEEPSHTLPKTQWTRSGVFYEEDLAYPRPLANSTATQFLVASLNSSKKNKPAALTVSATTMNKALDFKNKAIKEKKVNRVSSREVLFAKQRSAVNKKF